MRSCILKQDVPYIEPDLCDHRYFFVREQKNGVYIGSYACGIARDAALRKLRQYRQHGGTESIWLRDLDHYAHNRAMLGFLIEEACLSSITIRGLDIGMELSSANGIATKWFQNVPLEYSLEEGTTIYCPVQYHFRAIDALILRLFTVGGKKKAAMFPLQITIARRHSDSPGKFFESWKDWSDALKDYEVEVHFLWITDDEYHSSKWFEKKTRPSRGAADENVISPDHTRHRIPLGVVSMDIANNLRRARERKGISSARTVAPEGYNQVTTSSGSSSGTQRKPGRPKKAESIAGGGGEVGKVSAASGGAAKGKRKAAAKLTTMREPRAKEKLTVRRSARLAAIVNR